MTCTYIHKTLEGKVFYVGCGGARRPSDKSNRTTNWWEQANKGYTIEVAAIWPTQDDALAHERFLIQCFRDLGHPLVNITDGGKGTPGLKHRPDSLLKMSKAQSGENNSNYGKCGELSPHFGRRGADHWMFGRTITEETRVKLKARTNPMLGRTGDSSPWFGRSHTQEAMEKMKESRAKQPRYVCLECGLESKSAGMKNHQKHKHHTGFELVKANAED